MPTLPTRKRVDRFSQQYVNDVHLKIIEDMAHDIADMTGIYSNTSFLGRTFPQLWKFMTWCGCSGAPGIHTDQSPLSYRMRIIFGTLVYRYFWVLGPHIWRELRDNTFVPLHKSEKEYNEEVRLKCPVTDAILIHPRNPCFTSWEECSLERMARSRRSTFSGVHVSSLGTVIAESQSHSETDDSHSLIFASVHQT